VQDFRSLRKPAAGDLRVNRFERLEDLGPLLDDNASKWEEILCDSKASALRLFGRLEALARLWSALQREVLPPFGLNYAELTTLGTLRTLPPSSHQAPCELRRLLGQSSAGMTRILDKLEGEGLVRRKAHEEDGRRLDVVLTRRGAKLCEQALERLLAVEAEILLPLGKRRIGEVLQVFDALLAGFSRRRD